MRPMLIQCDGTCGNDDGKHDTHLACSVCDQPLWKCQRDGHGAMMPMCCANHEANELNCVECTAIRKAYYAALVKEEERKEEEWQTHVSPFSD